MKAWSRKNDYNAEIFASKHIPFILLTRRSCWLKSHSPINSPSKVIFTVQFFFASKGMLHVTLKSEMRWQS